MKLTYFLVAASLLIHIVGLVLIIVGPRQPEGTVTADVKLTIFPTPVCGNAVVEFGEDCEPPGTATCDATCHSIAAAPAPGGRGGAVPPTAEEAVPEVPSEVLPLPEECSENWECSAWEPAPCEPGEMQTRHCIDVQGCGTTKSKPDETQLCPSLVLPPEVVRIPSIETPLTAPYLTFAYNLVLTLNVGFVIVLVYLLLKVVIKRGI